MEQLLVLNPESASESEIESYPLREAARAVVVDADDKVALLCASLKNYYKLPGGGLEKGEAVLTALQRECKEEIGCEIEVQKEIGIVTEYRKMFNLTQISYCYVAHVRGEKGTPLFSNSELADGFESVWLPFQEALQAVAESATADLEGKLYIIPRDTAILQAAKQFFRP